MLIAFELEPDSIEATRILAEWQAVWGQEAPGGGIELKPAESLSAMLDLKSRCHDQGLTINASFPDNL